ncbi:MAG: helix-turn-helix domain-containing protein [Deltaproteobacteria bacterium]|nr:helix-turn-helix domain-containing protein [Deltaproteobacteria bacterium]
MDRIKKRGLVEQIVRTSKQLGAAIRRRRRILKLSQQKVGDRIRLRQATISALENGRPGIRMRTLLDVMTALGLEIVVRERSTIGKDIEEIF